MKWFAKRRIEKMSKDEIVGEIEWMKYRIAMLEAFKKHQEERLRN